MRIVPIPKKSDPDYQHEVEGIKEMADGSIRFKLVGGPLHGSVVRLWPPWDYLKFPSLPQGQYDLHPPLSLKKGKWCYVWHDYELQAAASESADRGSGSEAAEASDQGVRRSAESGPVSAAEQGGIPDAAGDAGPSLVGDVGID